MQSDALKPFSFLQFPEGDIYDHLPLEIVQNLSQGTSIEFDPKREHYIYRREAILLVLNYILENDNLLPIYTNEAFRQNIRCYLENFIYPNLWRNYEEVQFEFVTTASTKKPEKVPPCVLMHGRFNGVPHPGYVRSLKYIRENYELPTTLAIETDNYSVAYGQIPFLDPVFRASLLWYTGIIDRLVVNEAPYHAHEHPDDVYDYWDLMYGIDTFILNPAVLIAHGDEDFWRKDDRKPMRLNIRTLDMLNVNGLKEFHMSDLRNAEITPEQVQAAWRQVVEA